MKDVPAQLSDPAAYAAIPRIPYSQAHKCEVPGCNISQEEHHRLMFGVMAELREFKRNVENDR